MSSTERRQLVVKSHPGLSLSKQCEILGISRSMSYYKPRRVLYTLKLSNSPLGF
jgi:putative transposase